jgi:putative nucleotidyltransferase with HDIG domain
MASIFSKVQYNYYGILKVVLFILAIVIVVWISPKESFFRYEFQQGKPWNHNDLIAPFDFSILKTEKQIAEERNQILANFSPYFKYYDDITNVGRENMDKLFGERWRLRFGNDRQQDSLKFGKFLDRLYNQIEKKGIIRYDAVLEGKTESSRIRLIVGNEVTDVPLGSLYNIRSANTFAQSKIVNFTVEDSIFLQNIINQSLVQNVYYEDDLSQNEINQIMSEVSPTRGLVQKGELIISTGEVVSPEKYQVLLSLKKEYEQELGTSEARKMIISGMVLIITLLFIIQFLFLLLYKKRFYDALKNILIILITQTLLIAAAHFIFYNYPQLSWMIPYAILPVILVAFLDAGIAIIVHLITVLILGFFAPNSFTFFYTEFAAGLIAVFTLRDLSKRSDLFRTSLSVFMTYIVVYVSMLLVQDGSLDNFSPTFVTYLAGSSVLLLLAFPIIFVYEKIFGVITHLSLLELSNTNNTLLRDLAVKAPGTFQHSLQVANLASEALYEIGGDSLLARTGALYHDIGKMNNPLYFVENQVSGYNPHDELSFEESAQIIIGHVLDGIEMARKARLPEQIIDFIRTHHGNRRVEYFYRLERKLNPGMEVDPSTFTYHGPIPFSRETAVVMMADSVEAASRSLSEPDEQKINDLVDNIIGNQMKENQFVNANITMKEIYTVIKVLKKKLLNIHHVRIAYPD